MPTISFLTINMRPAMQLRSMQPLAAGSTHRPAAACPPAQRLLRNVVLRCSAASSSSSSFASDDFRSMVMIQVQALQDARAAERRAYEAERRAYEAELKIKDMQLEKRTADLLFIQGYLNMRGVLEFTEKAFRETNFIWHLKRVPLWTQLLMANPGLLACLETASGKHGADQVSYFMEDMYGALSDPVHGDHSPQAYSKSSVVIHHSNPHYVQALECICKEYSYPFQVQPWRDVQKAEGKGQSGAEGGEGSENLG